MRMHPNAANGLMNGGMDGMMPGMQNTQGMVQSPPHAHPSSTIPELDKLAVPFLRIGSHSKRERLLKQAVIIHQQLLDAETVAMLGGGTGNGQQWDSKGDHGGRKASDLAVLAEEYVKVMRKTQWTTTKTAEELLGCKLQRLQGMAGNAKLGTSTVWKGGGGETATCSFSEPQLLCLVPGVRLLVVCSAQGATSSSRAQVSVSNLALVLGFQTRGL
jgi:hypothetical protein